MKNFKSHHERPYGVGVAYRYVIHEEVMQHRDSIDLLEIPTEDYVIRERQMRGDPLRSLLREALREFPSVTHGISLSLGTVEKPSASYLHATRRLLEGEGIDIFSEHLAFHRVDGNDLTMFLAMPFEEESVAWLKAKYRTVSRALNRPFALENVTYPFAVPQASLEEADFFRRVGEELGCTFLLDATNVFNNAHNHGYDPWEYLDRYPLDRVSQVHLAGGHQNPDGTWEDSHSQPVMEPVWPIYEEILKRSKCEIVILERDSRFCPFESVQADIDKARKIFLRHRPETPEGQKPFSNTIETSDEVNVLDPEAPEFSQLRAFQRSLMGRLSDPEFAAAFKVDPEGAAGESFGLRDPLWVKRLVDCDPAKVDDLTRAFQAVDHDRKRSKKEYESSEWAGWAQLLAEESEAADAADAA